MHCLHVTDNSNGTYSRGGEQVWNTNGMDDFAGQAWHNAGYPADATGGGCSTGSAAAPWQKNVPGYASTGCGSNRLSADISAVADPFTGFDIYDSYNYASASTWSSWKTMGGTSLASPLIAGMWADAGGALGAKYPTLNLYSHHASSAVYDVTRGGNGFCGGDDPTDCSESWASGEQNPNLLGLGLLDCAWNSTGSLLAPNDTQCNASKGYDGPSGLGTPNGGSVFLPAAVSVSINVPSSVVANKAATSTASPTDTYPGAAPTFTWTTSNGKSASGQKVSFTFAKAGTYTVKVAMNDIYSHSTTHSVTVTVKS